MRTVFRQIIRLVLAVAAVSSAICLLISAPRAGAEEIRWTKYDNTIPGATNTTSTNGRIPLGTTGRGDDNFVYDPCVIKDGSTNRMWYAGYDGTTGWRIYYATSLDGLTWTKYDNSVPDDSNTTGTNGCIPLGTGGRGDITHVRGPAVIKDGSTYKMWYSGYNAGYRIYYATSTNGLDWTKYDNTIPGASNTTSTNGRVPFGTANRGDDVSASTPTVIKDGSTYKMWYTGYDGTYMYIFYATSTNGLTWTKNDNTVPPAASDTTNWGNGRIPLGTTGRGDDNRAWAPTVIKDGSTYRMWYSGRQGSAYRIFYATSTDGLAWTKYDNTIPDVSDTTGTNGRIPLGNADRGDDSLAFLPEVIKDGSTYKMWYGGGGANYRIYHATGKIIVPGIIFYSY